MRALAGTLVVGTLLLGLGLNGCASTLAPPPLATDAEVEEQLAQEFAERWDALELPNGIPQPDATTVKLTSRASWAYLQVECLVENGLHAREVSGDFSIDPDQTHTREESLVIRWTCERQYPVDPRSVGYLTIPQTLFMYDYFATRLAPCLELQGLDVPPPTDRAAYVGAIRAGGAWNPYFAADGTALVSSDAELAALDARCPPLPDDPYGWYRPSPPAP
jgi:hypothetical protein